MPRYSVGTFLNPKEHQKLVDAAKKEGLSKYKLIRDAINNYCEACLDGEKEVVRTSEESRESVRDSSESDENSEDSL